ncbi:ATP-dependent RNA helicase dbp6 [Paracoccidioides lutzii Pb01]|uniref:RNA helicase n=1 Tax=Paracoccidioides lutzii (strain ATCC MYA-826 / Pb01) TaxID=502779 RepID=C1HEB0_PARBA|nr:ATP-dependent RNA helicase dbp6 [Paracoccidioides lutzii Pb01]EEH41390.2 ATP-dependent RNA helicase dbp6 [Paracoccidioides lutzii Pb01]
MTASFYSRYVPPRNSFSSKSDIFVTPPASAKRKGNLALTSDASIPVADPSKKAKNQEQNKKSDNFSLVEPFQRPQDKPHEAGSDPCSKAKCHISPSAREKKQDRIRTTYNSPEGRKQSKDTEKDTCGNSGYQQKVSAFTDSIGGARNQCVQLNGGCGMELPTKGSKKRKLEQDDDAEDKQESKKHARIMSKFETAKFKSRSAVSEKGASNPANSHNNREEEIVPHGLEPLPQPAQAPVDNETPTYSTLPAWLTEPFDAPVSVQQNFSDLGVNPRLVSILEKRGYIRAFPIQAAVFELLSKGENRHPGDLCISAATGSGKTLAYALPMVEGIEQSAIPKLRGLVIVPTRELVKQARDACELCATGTGLRIGTAVGTTSLKEEQALLIKRDQLYSPFASQTLSVQSMSSEDWAAFNVQEYIAEANVSHTALPNHVTTSSPCIDILICTPGRLVDHIRCTQGFTLEHLEWLVVDEADRLLNESFQEWTEVVFPALEMERIVSNSKSGFFLNQLGCRIHRRQLQKIILSATVTRDIPKLNSLRLRNPKLVVPESHEINDTPFASQEQSGVAAMAPSANHAFRLPSTLCEMFVPVGDGAAKPLYLLALLLSHFKSEREDAVALPEQQSNYSTSDTGSIGPSPSLPDDNILDSSSASDTASSADTSEASMTFNNSPDHKVPTVSSVLVFTKSSESASRLALLLALMHPPLAKRIGTLTKSNKSTTSRKTLSAYRNGKISIVIATDCASRGLDLPSLTHVVNYDVPASLTSYIHRVGRTARAGNSGSAWTFVAHREGRWFSNEIMKCPETTVARAGSVEKVTINLTEQWADFIKKYSEALGELQAEVEEGHVKQIKPKKVEAR